MHFEVISYFLFLLLVCVCNVSCSNAADNQSSNEALKEKVEKSTFNMKNLPPNIEEKVVEYINEQCNNPKIDQRLLSCKGNKADRKLKYLGEFTKYSQPWRYWEFSCNNSSVCLATVHPMGDTYALEIEYEYPK
jgi:hypothetical protein